MPTTVERHRSRQHASFDYALAAEAIDYSPLCSADPGVGLAHQMHGVAVFAFGQGVMLGELDPVLSLVGRQDSAPLAQRADAVEGREDRRPDELRPIGDSVHRLQQGFIHLERDDFLLFLADCSWDIVPRRVLIHRITSIYGACAIRLPPGEKIGYVCLRSAWTVTEDVHAQAHRNCEFTAPAKSSFPPGLPRRGCRESCCCARRASR